MAIIIRTLWGVALVSLIGATQVSAETGFREGMPEVLAGESSHESKTEEMLARFKTLYNSRNSPVMLVYWNRVLTDNHESSDVQVLTESITKSNTALRYSGQLETVKRDSGAKRYVRLNDEEIEAGFVGGLIDNEVRVIDRNTAIRKLSNKYIGEEIDKLSLESLSLESNSEYLVEVAQKFDPKSPSLPKYKITVKNVVSGLIELSKVLSLKPNIDNYEYRAVPGKGYQRKIEPRDMSKVGELLARRFLGELGERW